MVVLPLRTLRRQLGPLGVRLCTLAGVALSGYPLCTRRFLRLLRLSPNRDSCVCHSCSRDRTSSLSRNPSRSSSFLQLQLQYQKFPSLNPHGLHLLWSLSMHQPHFIGCGWRKDCSSNTCYVYGSCRTCRTYESSLGISVPAMARLISRLVSSVAATDTWCVANPLWQRHISQPMCVGLLHGVCPNFHSSFFDGGASSAIRRSWATTCPASRGLLAMVAANMSGPSHPLLARIIIVSSMFHGFGLSPDGSFAMNSLVIACSGIVVSFRDEDMSCLFT